MNTATMFIDVLKLWGIGFMCGILATLGFMLWVASFEWWDKRKQSKPKLHINWQPINTAPLDNKQPLILASFNPRTGDMTAIGFDGIWQEESESWEMPEVYYYWATANGNVEEPTHWCYQDNIKDPEWHEHAR